MQLAFTCSNLSIETLEQDLKYVQIYVRSVSLQNDVNDVVFVSSLLTLNVGFLTFLGCIEM